MAEEHVHVVKVIDKSRVDYDRSKFISEFKDKSKGESKWREIREYVLSQPKNKQYFLFEQKEKNLILKIMIRNINLKVKNL